MYVIILLYRMPCALYSVCVNLLSDQTSNTYCTINTYQLQEIPSRALCVCSSKGWVPRSWIGWHATALTDVQHNQYETGCGFQSASSGNSYTHIKR